MNRWSNIRHSIFFKFALAFLAVGIVPLLVLSGFALNQFTSQVERHTENNYNEMILYLSKNADDIFRNYNELSKTMYYNAQYSSDQAPRYIREEIDQNARMNQMTINDFLKTVLFSDSHIVNALFVRESDQTVFQQSRISRSLDPNIPYPPVNWSYALASQPKELAVFPPHLETYYASTDMVMTFARSFIDTSGKPGGPVIGTLYFDVDLDIFGQLFKQVNLSKNDQMYIVDAKGYILYSNQSDKLGKRFDEPGIREDNRRMLFAQPMPFTKGQVIGLTSKADLFASMARIRSTVILVSAICLLALVLLGMLFSRRFTLPILDIMRHMIQVESGNLDAAVETRRKDEIGRLAHGFNRMIERLRQFIHDAYVLELKRKQTELNALKSQIRPHYLYNTLEVIRMSAVANDDGQVADMIHALSDQLKYVIDYGEEWVSVERELDHLRNYFHLINVRFDGRIELKLDVSDDSLLLASILKLTIQPLVENAVQHGFRPRVTKGMVMVTIERAGDNDLAVTVYDNGSGMSPEEVDRLNRRMEDDLGTTGKSIGLKNVHERVRQACGAPYGILVESKPDIGTSVRILFPLRMEERA